MCLDFRDQVADNGPGAQIGEVVTTIPTIGFNVESVTYKNLNLNVWVWCFAPSPVLRHCRRTRSADEDLR